VTEVLHSIFIFSAYLSVGSSRKRARAHSQLPTRSCALNFFVLCVFTIFLFMQRFHSLGQHHAAPSMPQPRLARCDPIGRISRFSGLFKLIC
jgi:hypothetical protein